jgi:16S rRNA (cytosine967-C5)-methyltransferase
VALWLDELGTKETQLLCEQNNSRPALHLRINSNRVNRSDYLSRLAKIGVEAKESPYFEDFVILSRGFDVQKLPGFDQGYFAVQDQSTAMATLLVEPQPGDAIIDLCAAPGGKSFFLADLMHNDGKVIAVDISRRRVKQLAANRYRLQNSNVFPIVADGTKVRLKGADKVIIDAPCSGLGVLSRRVDLRWKRKQEDLARFRKTQSGLLTNAATMLKSGGVLVYSTCTINRGENENVIEQFLKKHSDFKIESGPKQLDHFKTSGGFYRTVPYKQNMDGMFAVRMRKS